MRRAHSADQGNAPQLNEVQWLVVLIAEDLLATLPSSHALCHIVSSW
jgi:hypothetical protein